MQQTTDLLLRISSGDCNANDQLMPMVNDKLRVLAAKRLQHERVDHTRQPAVLVNDAFLRRTDRPRLNRLASLLPDDEGGP